GLREIEWLYSRIVGRCPAMLMVTVGTAVASRPPYRSRRALLTHRAPPSGSGVEAVTRQRVYRSDWRKEAGDALDEPLPAEACRLRSEERRVGKEGRSKGWRRDDNENVQTKNR